MSRDAHALNEEFADASPRERFRAALECRALPGHVPHFEMEMFLTMEGFGKVHPCHRAYFQWDQMTPREREFHLEDLADLYIAVAERFHHYAIRINPTFKPLEDKLRLADLIRERTEGKYFQLLEGDATFEIPSGSEMEDVSIRMLEDPESVEADLEGALEKRIKEAGEIHRHGGIDGFTLCSDYCFNAGPFLPMDWFDRFITGRLQRLIREYRQMGFYTIKHTDGNIMPILSRLVDARPHALHSLDPQAGVDLESVARITGGRVALCGNVDSGFLHAGKEEGWQRSARAALSVGRRLPGYVFCTSNCVYTGIPLDRYERMIQLWLRKGTRD